MYWLSLKQFILESKRRKTARGFSILEVLITAAIIGIITGLVTIKYGSFNNSILLKNQAYQVALELREMQSRSLSAVGSGDNFRASYGIYFSASGQSQNEYVMFLDISPGGGAGNGLRASDGSEDLETRRLDNRFRIQNIICDGVSGDVHIVFRRPNFDAVMNNGARGNCSVVIGSVASDVTRSVVINAAGQITVE